MKRNEVYEKTKRAERLAIFEMIESTCALASRKGAHPLLNNCNCIACVNKRKRLLEEEKHWKFRM